MNSIFLTGNLGKDPEVRSSSAGTTIVNFSVGDSLRQKDAKTGEYINKTNWHSCVAFGVTAEYAAKYIKKGDKVAVKGRVVYETWTDKEEVVRYATRITVEQIELMRRSAKNDSAEDDGRISTLESEKPKAVRQSNAEIGFDDDIPF